MTFIKKVIAQIQTSSWTVRIIAFVLALACLESWWAFRSYRSLIHPEDWDALAKQLPAELKESEGVFVHPTWLQDRARMYLPQLSDPALLGAADLHDYSQLWVLRLSGQGDAWEGILAKELSGEVQPRLLESFTIGPFELERYEKVSHSTKLDSLLKHLQHSPETTEISKDKSVCRAHRNTHWTCGGHDRLELRFAEIDYRPRYCLASDVRDNSLLSIRVKDFDFGDQLIGHIGFDGFNPRRRNDSPAELTVLRDQEVLARIVVGDDEGWQPFSLPTQKGEGELEVQLFAPVQGQWQRGRYQGKPVHSPCIELRSFTSKSGDPE